LRIAQGAADRLTQVTDAGARVVVLVKPAMVGCRLLVVIGAGVVLTGLIYLAIATIANQATMRRKVVVATVSRKRGDSGMAKDSSP